MITKQPDFNNSAAEMKAQSCDQEHRMQSYFN